MVDLAICTARGAVVLDEGAALGAARSCPSANPAAPTTSTASTTRPCALGDDARVSALMGEFETSRSGGEFATRGRCSVRVGSSTVAGSLGSARTGSATRAIDSLAVSVFQNRRGYAADDVASSFVRGAEGAGSLSLKSSLDAESGSVDASARSRLGKGSLRAMAR